MSYNNSNLNLAIRQRKHKFLTGHFFHDFSDVLEAKHYAVGAPKANKLRGRVYLCPDCFNATSTLRRELQSNPSYYQRAMKLDGEQFGSRFGETLIALDLDRDGDDDLVVGAPLFSDLHGVRSLTFVAKLKAHGTIFVVLCRFLWYFSTDM